jgi:hypothetical protein
MNSHTPPKKLGHINPSKSQTISNWNLSPIWELETQFKHTCNKKLFDEVKSFRQYFFRKYKMKSIVLSFK